MCEAKNINYSYSGDMISADDVVEAVLRGFKAGEAAYGLTARVLLCCIRGLDQFSEDVLRLCVKYRDQGVVGMDIAGNCIFKSQTSCLNEYFFQVMRRA